jgi:hypothetical protein
MKVHFLQSGGFAGLFRGCALDTADLAPADREELERLVRQSGITGTSKQLSSTARDLHQYEVEIERPSGTAALTVDDATIPEAARPLLRFLRERARPVKAPARRPRAAAPRVIVILVPYALAYRPGPRAAAEAASDGSSEDGLLHWRIRERPTGDLTIRLRSDDLALENTVVRLGLGERQDDVILRRVTQNEVGAEHTIPKDVRLRLPEGTDLRLEVVRQPPAGA